MELPQTAVVDAAGPVRSQLAVRSMHCGTGGSRMYRNDTNVP